MQIVLDSGILANRVATGFQATIRATDQENTEFNLTDLFCNSNLVALVKATVLPVLNLGEVNVEVLEIFKEDEPMFVNKGQEISIKHDFTITDLFGCSMQIKADQEYYIFASIKEYNDDIDSSPYWMDFAVDLKSTSTPANFLQQISSVETDPPQCEMLPAV